MTAKTFTRSFAGGEISPLLRARLDLAKNQTGLALCENWVVTPQGPVETRAGFQFVNRALDIATPPVLLPFTYNADQSFALEFGAGYIRFHTAGGTLLEAGTAIAGITQANPAVFNTVGHGYAMGDWVFLSGIGGMTELNGRWGFVTGVPDADHYSLTGVFGEAFDTTAMPAFTAGGTASRLYQISTPYLASNLLDLHYVQSADVMTITHQDHAPRELRRLGATNWTLTPISFAPTIAAPAAPTLTPSGPGGGTPIPHEYATTALAQDTLEESTRSAANNAAWDLTVVGNYIQIDPSLVAGAIRYNVYKSQGGIFGYIGQSDGNPFRDQNLLPDMSKTPPEISAPFASENPRAVSYFEQRRVFGGGGANPQAIWLTSSGTESSMSYSIPRTDDNSITARIVAREAHIVRHLVPMNDLLALTSGGVWKLTSSDGGSITPGTFSARPQSRIGASNVQPVITSEAVVYVQERGNHLREVNFKWESQNYAAGDMSILAPHLFDFHTISQLTASVAPTQIVWAVRDDGMLLGLTYQPEHEVKAWHRHTTDGLFKSICAIPEGAEDGIYAVVQRTVAGAPINLIERMHTRQFAALADAFFVDCGLTYDGVPATVITGLRHLEGAEVAVLANGGVHPRRTVVGGAITLEAPAAKVHVGLPYNCDAQTMPLAIEAAPAFGQSIPKNVNKVALSVYQSSAIKAGPSFDKLREYPQRTIHDPYGSPPGLKTGIAELALDPLWQQDGSVCIRQDQPLPMTLRAIIIDAATGG